MNNKNIKCNPNFKISKKDVDINTYTEYFEQDLKKVIKEKIKNLFVNNSFLTINNILSINLTSCFQLLISLILQEKP